MKHHLTINIVVEGDIPQALEVIGLIEDQVSRIHVPKTEIVGFNSYQFDVEVEVEKSLAEEQENGRQEESE